MKFQEMQIAITDTTHCRAVCDVLESLGYKGFSLSEFALSEDGTTGIVAFSSGSYTDISSAPVGGKITTLQDLLAMRDDLVRKNAKHPEELPFIDDEPPAYYGNAIRPKPRQRVYAVMREWSPDWSQAPEWADAWRTTECGQAWWSRGNWSASNRGGWSASGSGHRAEKAPSFGFVGDWKQSETRRPLQHVILEQTVSA